MDKIVVIGGGGHAKVVISIIKKTHSYNILGYSDIEDKGKLLGICYFGNDDELSAMDNKHKLVLGIGQIRNLESRRKIVETFLKSGFKFETIISTDAIVNEEVAVDDGTIIMDGVVINSGTSIGKYSIINTKVTVDHDCRIGDFVHIAPGCTVCGEVIIGDNTFIGAGSIITNGAEIGNDQFIKAHSLVK